MIKRRSLHQKRKTIKRSKRRTKRRSNNSRKFGKNENETELLKHPDFRIASNYFKPQKIIEFITWLKNLINNTLTGIKPDENTNLVFFEKIERMVIGWYMKGFKDFIEKLSPAQVILLSEGKYTKELKNKLLFRIEPPPVDENQISGFKNVSRLLFLKSILGKIILNNIKEFFKTLSPTQLVLLINGKYDLGNAMYNSFLHTKYPTKKDISPEQLINDIN